MATPGTRNDPYRGFRFRLEIQGIQIAGFSGASLPETSGTDASTGELSSQTTSGTLSLQRGLTDSMDLYNWFSQVSQFGPDSGGRKNVSVILVDEDGDDQERWNISDAWPSQYSAADFSASSSEVMIEMLDLKVETITRVM
jgi:phage tail-like protein